MQHLKLQKQALLTQILRDHDPKVPLYKHLQEWQDLTDTVKYQLIAEAMGQKFKAQRIPNRTLRTWLKKGFHHV